LTKYKISNDNNIDSSIEIPREDYDLIAKIERAQILRGQANSIRDNREDIEIPPYSVLKSRSFRKAITKLDQTTMVAIEDKIDDIAMNAKKSNDKNDPQDYILKLRVPGTPLKIHYSIDDDNRLIKIIDLQGVSNN
jgi:mRNA-degrading endonuclease RelE of RelBE toxin-antitoxin system